MPSKERVLLVFGMAWWLFQSFEGVAAFIVGTTPEHRLATTPRAHSSLLPRRLAQLVDTDPPTGKKSNNGSNSNPLSQLTQDWHRFVDLAQPAKNNKRAVHSVPSPCIMTLTFAMDCPDRSKETLLHPLENRRNNGSGMFRWWIKHSPRISEWWRRLQRVWWWIQSRIRGGGQDQDSPLLQRRPQHYTRYSHRQRAAFSNTARTLLKRQSSIWAASCEYETFSRQSFVQNAMNLQMIRKEVEYETALEEKESSLGRRKNKESRTDDHKPMAVGTNHDDATNNDDNATVFVVTFLLSFDDNFNNFVVPRVKDRATLQETLLQLTTVAQRKDVNLNEGYILVFPGGVQSQNQSVRKEHVLAAFDTLETIW